MKPVSWTDQARPMLAAAFPSRLDLSIIRGECLRGEAQLWRMAEGWGLSRVEGSELVLIAYVGKNYRQTVQQVIATFSADPAINSIRAHTIRSGLSRWLSNMGWQYQTAESVPGNWVFRWVY